MIATPNMNLVAWDQESDDFTHSQLAADLIAIDSHDHSAGNGVQINTPGIAPSAITTPLLANGAVTHPILATNAVATGNIQAGAVGTAQITNGAITTALIANNAVGYAQLDPHVVPLGTVAMWWRGPSSGATPGGGWEVMDGRPWAGIANSLGLTTGNIPNMIWSFPRGSDLATIGTTGGSSSINLQHAHAVTAHSHGIPSHAHPISEDGNHFHTWIGGFTTWTRTNAFDVGLQMKDTGNVNRQNVYYTLYIKNTMSSSVFVNPTTAADGYTDGFAPMDTTGQHNHSGGTGGNGDMGTYNATAGTDNQLGTSVPITPPFIGLAFIMRVR